MWQSCFPSSGYAVTTLTATPHTPLPRHYRCVGSMTSGFCPVITLQWGSSMYCMPCILFFFFSAPHRWMILFISLFFPHGMRTVMNLYLSLCQWSGDGVWLDPTHMPVCNMLAIISLCPLSSPSSYSLSRFMSMSLTTLQAGHGNTDFCQAPVSLSFCTPFSPEQHARQARTHAHTSLPPAHNSNFGFKNAPITSVPASLKFLVPYIIQDQRQVFI